MKVGEFELSLFNFGDFRLDGGSMFGSVPKTLWSKLIPVDSDNRIPLATRCIVLRSSSRLVLVDVGNGSKWSEKLSAIYDFRNAPKVAWPFDPMEVTDVILTHLHFDHAGGISELGADGSLQPTFPKARVYLQRANLENAHHPSLKERASYMQENYAVLEKMQVDLLNGDTEIFPGIVAHRVDGHTVGQQWLELQSDRGALFYSTDLVPTSRHLPLPYHMGYDSCATTLLKEKAAFLERAVKEDATLVFEHDPDTPMCKVVVDNRGHYGKGDVVEL